MYFMLYILQVLLLTLFFRATDIFLQIQILESLDSFCSNSV
jgi:hypothetical protein